MTDQPKQIAGSHYLGMKIQPRDLAMSNQWDCDAFSCLKYLSRYERKSTPIEDLQKAHHFAEMRQAWAPKALAVPAVVRMSDYIVQNGFDGNAPLKYALRALWDTVYILNGSNLYSPLLLRKIDTLISAVEEAAPLG